MYSLFKLSINIDKTLISHVNCLQVIIIVLKIVLNLISSMTASFQ